MPPSPGVERIEMARTRVLTPSRHRRHLPQSRSASNDKNASNGRVVREVVATREKLTEVGTQTPWIARNLMVGDLLALLIGRELPPLARQSKRFPDRSRKSPCS